MYLQNTQTIRRQILRKIPDKQVATYVNLTITILK